MNSFLCGGMFEVLMGPDGWQEGYVLHCLQASKNRILQVCCTTKNNNNNNINYYYYYYLLQLGCHPVAVVILHVYKI